jgi:hypothetical protein
MGSAASTGISRSYKSLFNKQSITTGTSSVAYMLFHVRDGWAAALGLCLCIWRIIGHSCECLKADQEEVYGRRRIATKRREAAVPWRSSGTDIVDLLKLKVQYGSRGIDRDQMFCCDTEIASFLPASSYKLLINKETARARIPPSPPINFLTI